MNVSTHVIPARRTLRSLGPLLLAVALCAATAMLVWLASHAIADSRQSARLLLERRKAEQLAVLWAGLAQDMKGAHATVLVPVTPGQLVLDPPYDLADAFARGFARFPYPDSFFAWKSSGADADLTYLFVRTDRPPVWRSPERLAGPYPVQVVRDPAALRTVIAEARRHAHYDRTFTVFETMMEGVPYQVVVNFLYRGDDRGGLFGLVGFTVNLDWVHRIYFDELALQMARIGGAENELSLAILDERGAVVTETRPADTTISPASRAFPLVFLDRALLTGLPPQSAPFRYWTARVSAAQGSPLAAAALGGTGTLILISLAAAVAVVGLVVTARGMRAAAELAAMKSDFVSSVTHELKTPLSGIRLIADTLASGRYDSRKTIDEYATLLSREGKHLTGLIDNLLAYARLSDARHAYVYESVNVGDLVDDALDHFEAVLIEQRFTVEVEVPSTLPTIRADRPALLQALDNLIDNAIKYSDGTRVLQVRAHAADRRVTISVADRGVGIRADDIERVCDKFFRGREVRTGGSGLGLAIASQIVHAHGGRLGIESAPGHGTRVDVVVPQAAAS
jgi:signal transduction histidine kinase